MKKLLSIIALFFACSFYTMAQTPRFIFPDSAQVKAGGDSLKSVSTERLKPSDDRHAPSHEHGLTADSLRKDSLMRLPRITTWKIDRRTGERYIVPVDTLLYNYQQSTIPDGQSVAMGFLGPLGSPALSKLFFDRKESDHFTFYDAYYLYNKEPDKQYFYNVRLPYSRLNYQRGGGKLMNEERLDALLTMNFSPQLNLGFDVDYIYSRGFYNSQATKHIDWTVFGNYIGDRIEAHAFLSTARITNFENGGITNDGFITNPDSIGQNFTTTDVPVKFSRTWNRLKTDQVYLAGRYNLGYYEDTADTAQANSFVPVASIIYTTDYKRQYRRFLSYDTTNVVIDNQVLQRIDQFYKQRTYDTAVNDSSTYSSFKNTFALSMREGFKDWVKFGLTAFLEHEIRNFSMLDTTSTNPDRRVSHRENAVT
ncbi:MAG: putative porin, partial [Dysgonamonadaceae bacterium]|nr:putative porin [Dysgonamonadaceae bacterium]